MQNNQHTPGPWIVRLPEETHGCGHVISGNGESIAQTTGRGWTSDERAKRNEANARLIASAPDLLAALQNARDAMISLMDETADMPETEGADLCWDSIKECSAAITKATGNE